MSVRYFLPPERQGTGQGLFQATCFGVSAVVVNVLGGQLHGVIGYRGLFAACAAVGIIGIAIGWRALPRVVGSIPLESRAAGGGDRPPSGTPARPPAIRARVVDEPGSRLARPPAPRRNAASQAAIRFAGHHRGRRPHAGTVPPRIDPTESVLPMTDRLDPPPLADPAADAGGRRRTTERLRRATPFIAGRPRLVPRHRPLRRPVPGQARDHDSATSPTPSTTRSPPRRRGRRARSSCSTRSSRRSCSSRPDLAPPRARKPGPTRSPARARRPTRAATRPASSAAASSSPTPGRSSPRSTSSTRRPASR